MEFHHVMAEVIPMNPMGDTNAFFTRDNQRPIRDLKPWRFTISNVRKGFVENFQETPYFFH